MTTYVPPNGPGIELDDDSVEDLRALSHITRKDTNVLARQAIEQLRNTVVPSTREAPARAIRKGKGALA